MSQNWLEEMHSIRDTLGEMSERVDNLHLGLSCVLNDRASEEMEAISLGLDALSKRLNDATGAKIDTDYKLVRRTSSDLMTAGLAIALSQINETTGDPA